MGLDVLVAGPYDHLQYLHSEATETPMRWSLSYSGFNAFREKIAESVGVDLRSMDGYASDGRSWASVSDPLVPLLNHSDCDGRLTAEECEQMAARLHEVAGAWSEDEGWLRESGLELARMMRLCAEENLELWFS